MLTIEIELLGMFALALTPYLSEKYILKFGLRNLVRGVLASRHLKIATLAQLVEHSIRNRKVVGSNPTGGSIKYSFNETQSLIRVQRNAFLSRCQLLDEWHIDLVADAGNGRGLDSARGTDSDGRLDNLFGSIL